MKTINSLLIICLFATCNVFAGNAGKQTEKEITAFLADKKATVGVAVLTNDNRRMLVNNKRQYPLLSVFKLPIALAVLHQLDQKQIPLDSTIYVKASQLLPGTYSPLRKKFPDQDLTISFRELLKYSVALSDNNACDILIGYAGGIAEVNKYIKGLGIRGISLSQTEAQMHERDQNQYLNRGTPSAMTDLLKLFHDKELFAPQYKNFLWETLIQTSTGSNKLKGLLPKEVRVGHKTGSSNRTREGVKIADNDAGFVCLPNGETYYIAVFVMDSQETDETNAAIIARVSKIVYDSFLP